MKQKTNKKLKPHYNDESEDPSLYPDIAPWIQQVLTGRVDNFNYFLCKICWSKKFILSNMGVGAVRSHMKNQVKRKLSKHKMMQMINSTKNTLSTLLKLVEPQATGSSTSNPDKASTFAINALLLSEVQSLSSGVSSTTFKSKCYETLVRKTYFALDVLKNCYSLKNAE